MFDAGSRSEEPGGPRHQRVDGSGRVAFRRRSGGQSRLGDLHQRGAAKIRLPKTYDGPVEAVLLNTAGGLTSGDRLSYSVILEDGAEAVAATQAAERIYKALPDGGEARVENRVALGAGARLDWLAQETILFDGGRLRRRFEADLAPNASLLAIEPIVFGREAMGERVESGALRDQWRIRRSGQLIYADGVRLEGRISERLARPAALGGGRATAAILYAAPDAEARLAEFRHAIAPLGEDGVESAASAVEGVLSARLTASSGGRLMAAAARALTLFRRAPPPRVWRC